MKTLLVISLMFTVASASAKGAAECSPANKQKTKSVRVRLKVDEKSANEIQLKKLEDDLASKRITEKQFDKAAKPLLTSKLKNTRAALKDLSELVKNHPECFKDSTLTDK